MEILYYAAEALTTFLEVFVLVRCFDLFFTRRYGKKKHAIGRAVAEIVMTAVTLFLNSVQLFSWSTASVWAVLMVISAIVLFRTDVFSAAGVTVTFLLIISVIDLFCFAFLELVFGFRGLTFILVTEVGMPRTFLILFVKAVMVALYLLVRHRLRDKRIVLRRVEMLMLAVYSYVSLSCVNDLFSAIASGDVDMLKRSVLLACLFIGLGTVGLIWALQAQGRMRREVFEQESVRAQIDILERDNKQLSDAHRKISMLSHDFKNHLRTVQALAEKGSTEELQTYLAGLAEDMQHAENTVYTGVESVDTVINCKVSAARAAGIPITVSASYVAHGIRNVDLCVILSNLLDNAIEASAQLQPQEARFIRLALSCVGEMTVIKVENACDPTQPMRTTEGFFATTKRDAARHGYGLRIVRTVAERYGGTVETKCENGVFGAYLLFHAGKI